MIKLGRTRLDQGAKLACAWSPLCNYLLVDINVSLQTKARSLKPEV
jgi:hypothetical protein